MASAAGRRLYPTPRGPRGEVFWLKDDESKKYMGAPRSLWPRGVCPRQRCDSNGGWWFMNNVQAVMKQGKIFVFGVNWKKTDKRNSIFQWSTRTQGPVWGKSFALELVPPELIKLYCIHLSMQQTNRTVLKLAVPARVKNCPDSFVHFWSANKLVRHGANPVENLFFVHVPFWFGKI